MNEFSGRIPANQFPSKNDSAQNLQQSSVQYVPPLPPFPTQIGENERRIMVRELKQRKIEFLTHFTHVENLRGILKKGLQSLSFLVSDPTLRGALRVKPSIPTIWPHCVSLNLSFPNYRLFNELSNHSLQNWVVILVDAQILVNRPFYSFSGRVEEQMRDSTFYSQILPQCGSVQAFQNLFADFPEIKRSSLEIPDAFPTCPFSEILIPGIIPTEAFLQVWFASDYKLSQWALNYLDIAKGFDKKLWAAGMQFFSPRADYTYWRPSRGNSF